MNSYNIIHLIFICNFIQQYSSSCLNFKDKVQWKRKFFFKDKDIPIVIEVSPRASHKIVSHIISILLKERLGYQKVEFNHQNWDSINSVYQRFSCQYKQCVDEKPSSHINLEVWKSLGYAFNDKDKQYFVDCGPLGPKARKGVFVKSNAVSPRFSNTKFIVDYWRLFKRNINSCNFETKQPCLLIINSNITEIENEFESINKNLFPNTLISYTSVLDRQKTNSSGRSFSQAAGRLFSQQFQLYLDWYPNVKTVQGNFTRILFPDCLDNVEDNTCAFEVHQLNKVVWRHVKDHAPKAFQLIRDFILSQEEYESLLRNVRLDSNEEYYRVACDWVRNNMVTWTPWTQNWNASDKIYLPVLISDYGTWKASETFNASMRGVSNLNKHVFNNSHFEVFPIIHELPCNEDVILSDYLNIIEQYDPNIIGFIVCLCPKTFNSLIKVADIQNRIIVSASIESTHSMNVSLYRHFFTISPNMIHYNLVLIKMFHKFNWKRVVILKKDDHLVDHNMLPRYNITVLGVRSKKEEEINYNETYKFLESVKNDFKASIFIVDYYIHGTQIVMCAAGDLGMTLENGYVFILNPLINPHWLNNSIATPCSTNKAMLSKEYFIIKHDTTSEHRENYIRNNFIRYNYLAQLTHDAIWYLGKSFHELRQNFSSAHLSWRTTSVSEKYIDLLANQEQKMIGKKEKYDKKVFNQNHDRNGVWQIQQVSGFGMPNLIAVSLFKWDITNGFDGTTGLPNIINVTIVPIYTGKLKKPLLDVNRESNCPVEILREKFGWTCTTTLIVINLFAILLVVAALIFSLVCYYQRQKKQTEDRNKKPFEDLCTELSDIDIRSTDVIINLQVGKGAFGIVYGGEAKRKNHWESVAIKLIKKEADYQGKIDFLMEAKLMRNLEHPNIVKLIGICLNPPKPVIYLVMELVVNGDLEDHLLSHRITAQQDPMNKLVCPQMLTRFIKDIAMGAHYLHQNNLLHRDLACRNCFLSEDYAVKIGDFGLTRSISDSQENQYYRVSRHFVLPARWMPPEAVQFGYFSIQSDIWSLGVIIFEIATFCSRPYYNVSDEDVPELVKRNTMPLVTYLPENAKGSHTYKLIEKCCQYKRDDRLESMQNIITYLEENNECIQPFLTIDPPQHHIINIGNSGPNWMMNQTESSQRTGSLVSGGLSRFKSNSRSRNSAGNRGVFNESQNNFESFFRTEIETGFKENPEQIPFIPSEDEFITLNPTTNRVGSKKQKHRSTSRKITSNLNSSKSRSSDFMAKKIEDDQEPSYVSCPDQANIHQLGDFDPQDFPLNEEVAQFMRSTSGDDKSILFGKRIKTYRNGKIVYRGSSRNRKVKINISSTLLNKSKSKLSSSQGIGIRKISEPNGLRHELIQPLLYDRPANVLIQPKRPKNFKNFADEEFC